MPCGGSDLLQETQLQVKMLSLCSMRKFNHRVERPEIEAPVEDKLEETVIEEEVEFSKCGRSPKAHITLTGSKYFSPSSASPFPQKFHPCQNHFYQKRFIPGLAPDQAQIAEFPHMCVLFRTQKGEREITLIIMTSIFQ